jgi:MOSC domain-containing protein YiiM
MFKGFVHSIYIAPEKEAAMQSIESVRAVPTKGLEGDRYFNHSGTFWKDQPDYEVTLIEIEAFDGMKRESGLDLDPSEGRRNIVTRSVPLNHLVGKDFKVGDVVFRGIRLCEPCKHLQSLASKPNILSGLIHRGGLRAQVLTEGVIRVGDSVEEVLASSYQTPSR